MRTVIAHLIDDLTSEGVQDTIGSDILQKYHLMSLTQALINVHFPKDNTTMQRARERLKFEELFYIQLQILRQMKRREQNKGYAMPIVGKTFNALYRSLPFDLTNAQKRVIREIQTDLKSGKQMNRLLQGDVGSGKTIVAFLAMLYASQNGYQSALMAPTEVLARQHFEKLQEFCRKHAPFTNVSLLTGSLTASQQ